METLEDDTETIGHRLRVNTISRRYGIRPLHTFFPRSKCTRLGPRVLRLAASRVGPSRDCVPVPWIWALAMPVSNVTKNGDGADPSFGAGEVVVTQLLCCFVFAARCFLSVSRSLLSVSLSLCRYFGFYHGQPLVWPLPGPEGSALHQDARRQPYSVVPLFRTTQDGGAGWRSLCCVSSSFPRIPNKCYSPWFVFPLWPFPTSVPSTHASIWWLLPDIRIDRSGSYQIVIAMRWPRTQASQSCIFSAHIGLSCWRVGLFSESIPSFEARSWQGRVLQCDTRKSSAELPLVCYFCWSSLRRCSCCFSKLYITSAGDQPERRAALDIKLKFSTEEKGNNLSSFFLTEHFLSSCSLESISFLLVLCVYVLLIFFLWNVSNEEKKD